LDVLPDPDPTPDITYKEVKLFGPGESFYRAEIGEKAGKVYIRGILREDKGTTNPLSLTKTSAGILTYESDKVGEYDGKELLLCSGGYDVLCSLRFSTTKNTIYIEFPYPDNRAVTDDEVKNGDWSGFNVPLGNYEFQLFQPGNIVETVLDPKLFFRMKKSNGDITNPIRFSASGTEIRAMGEPIGSVDPSNLGLCTGNYSSACSIFAPGTDLNILPGW